MDKQFKEKKFSTRWYLFALPGFACGIAMMMTVILTKEFSLPFFAFAGLGLPLLLIAQKESAGAAKQLEQFILSNGTLEHTPVTATTAAAAVERLKSMGFDVTVYPMGNYYCVKHLDKRHQCIVFIQNHDTPDCPEAEEYSALYIKRMMGISLQPRPEAVLVAIDYGNINLEEQSEYFQTLRKGFTFTKNGMVLNFSAAYDTDKNILYLANAIKLVEWRKSNVMAKYTVELMTELFGV